MAAILIAEDEPRISSFVKRGLQAHGHSATVVADGPSAYSSARRGKVDLLVLDIGLPKMDGLTVLRRLRQEGSSIPVIMLSSRTSRADVAASMASGADDCLGKPFRFEELLSRVRRHLAAARPRPVTELKYGTLRLDLRTRRAHVGDYVVDLSARECALAETFLRHPGQVLTREQLLRLVWGHNQEAGSNVVDVYVRYLRRKLGAHRFVTLRGLGYRLEAV
ncbi:DNA-binding response regulator [Mycolicibacterium duvalii]|uniref:DNA-binding response regulator n=1 Tax=Mycolicibacterium duvalii TaxID=39688 RepID=A0A7I7JZW6_9MYCO|nr:response regulator transcription factor [Mycolicibacterium duvalii]MCV7367317.1 response regulator transcription factor [Mycolicibacterium duvalii]PEG43526.1 DNA-binding response regulator [Mycolicibacterium duvalii]BBX17313.1 DNA-binding response regulator [Mycolicibacterium duvalii]